MILWIICMSYRFLSFRGKEQQSNFKSHICESGVTNLLLHLGKEASVKAENTQTFHLWKPKQLATNSILIN